MERKCERKWRRQQKSRESAGSERKNKEMEEWKNLMRGGIIRNNSRGPKLCFFFFSVLSLDSTSHVQANCLFPSLPTHHYYSSHLLCLSHWPAIPLPTPLSVSRLLFSSVSSPPLCSFHLLLCFFYPPCPPIQSLQSLFPFSLFSLFEYWTDLYFDSLQNWTSVWQWQNPSSWVPSWNGHSVNIFCIFWLL